jgi:hypothetical protein
MNTPPALSRKQSLAIELFELMNITETARIGLREMLTVPPFNELPGYTEAGVERFIEALNAERAQHIEVIEMIFTEEELTFQVSIWRHPMWAQCNTKAPALTHAMNEIMSRVAARVFTPTLQVEPDA